MGPLSVFVAGITTLWLEFGRFRRVRKTGFCPCRVDGLGVLATGNPARFHHRRGGGQVRLELGRYFPWWH